jgi:hypothetical protein
MWTRSSFTAHLGGHFCYDSEQITSYQTTIHLPSLPTLFIFNSPGLTLAVWDVPVLQRLTIYDGDMGSLSLAGLLNVQALHLRWERC